MHICPGEVLSFTCIAYNATDIQWSIHFTGSLTTDVRLTLIEDDPIAQLFNVTRGGHTFSFSVVSQAEPMITALITTAAAVIDGAVVQCRDERRI